MRDDELATYGGVFCIEFAAKVVKILDVGKSVGELYMILREE